MPGIGRRPRRRLAPILATGAALLLAAACGPAAPEPQATPQPQATAAVPSNCRDEATGPETFTYVDRPGVGPNLTSLDVYLPAGCGPVPALVWVHGGGWRLGDKALDSVAGKVRVARELGVALVSVNYRLSSPGSGVRWPDHGDDVAAALAWLRTTGPDVGIDPTRVALIGHSAGAHLVAVAGADSERLVANGADPAALRCVVVLDTAAVTLSPDNPLHASAFGTDPEVLAGASPLTLVERNGAPAAEFLVVGRGSAARVAEQRSFVDAIVSRGGSAAFVDANPYDHARVSSAVGDPTDTVVTPPVRAMLGRCLAGTPDP